MDKGSILQTLGQVGAGEIGEVFREYLRGATREMLVNVMAEEVTLESYTAAQDVSEAQRLLLEALVAAGSMRRVGRVVNKQRGRSKSNVSRLWQKVGREKFAELRRRPLNVNAKGKPRDWLALMLDGVSLAKDLSAVVAVGITVEDGRLCWPLSLGRART